MTEFMCHNPTDFRRWVKALERGDNGVKELQV